MKDERGVSYILFVGIILSLGMFSVFWMFTSDLLDLLHPIFGTIMGLNSVADDGWNYWGFDALYYMFAMLVILAPIGIMWAAYNKAQKPMELYG